MAALWPSGERIGGGVETGGVGKGEAAAGSSTKSAVVSLEESDRQVWAQLGATCGRCGWEWQ